MSLALPFDCVYDDDGFVIDLWRPSRNKPRPMPEPQYEDKHVTQRREEDPDVLDLATLYDDHRVERPASRQWYYDEENYHRFQCSRIPPLNVRRYPFVLNGRPGVYTISHISRYADISPSRGPAMLLRRFRLVNELLDRTHAVGYEHDRSYSKSGEGDPRDSTPKETRWQGHGASKLRNEIYLADLVGDEDSDEELSFNVSAECSRASDRSDDSSDLESSMKTSSSYEEQFCDGDIYDFVATRSILDFRKRSADDMLDDGSDL